MTVTDDIKARLDIVQFISQYVPLKKAGRNYTAPCPFHQERTPSFVVFPDTQGWHCFGACSEGGDIFNFVMKKEGLDFVGALRFLAEKAGVELQERTSEQIQQDEQHEKLRGLLNEAATWFQKLLRAGPASQHARDYVQRRGINDDTLEMFRIGYAPAGWDGAVDHLRLIGYSPEEIVEAGVAVTGDSGRTYDRFRNRLVIPIFDERGRIIGFGARALAAEDNPKYLNSPQTPLLTRVRRSSGCIWRGEPFARARWPSSSRATWTPSRRTRRASAMSLPRWAPPSRAPSSSSSANTRGGWCWRSILTWRAQRLPCAASTWCARRPRQHNRFSIRRP
ncbi:MAG: hypothetical protein EHM39_03175 [Chloroflexi bacterium]|nr:MAG: hypothetical protein EHM39_03175 [Chloroflexota bacterium]